MSSIKITIIYDNNPFLAELKHGWGFSCLLEFNGKKIIFDTGGDKSAFFHNIQKLDIQLDAITDIVFSHQHWDHTAGFSEVIEHLSESCHIYVPFKFDNKLLAQIPKNRSVSFVKDIIEIDDQVFLMTLKGKFCDLKECSYIYEQSLVINRSKGAFVLTGCGHLGIKNILKVVHENLSKNIDWVIGGFHLHRSLRKTINSVVEDFNALNIQHVVPCHCTGQKAVGIFKDNFINKIHDIGTGSSFII